MRWSLLQRMKNNREESAWHRKQIYLPPAIGCCWENRLLLKMRTEKWSASSDSRWPFIWGCLIHRLLHCPFEQPFVADWALSGQITPIICTVSLGIRSHLKTVEYKDSQSYYFLSLHHIFTCFLKPHSDLVHTGSGNTCATEFPRHLPTALTFFVVVVTNVWFWYSDMSYPLLAAIVAF